MVNQMDDQYMEWGKATLPSLVNSFVHSLNGSVTVSLLFPSSLLIPQSTSSYLPSSLSSSSSSSSSSSTESSSSSSSSPFTRSSVSSLIAAATTSTSSLVNETLESAAAGVAGVAASTLNHRVINSLLTENGVLTSNEATQVVLSASSSSSPINSTSRLILTSDNISRSLFDETAGGGGGVPLSVEILMYIMYISVIIAALGGNGIVSFLILAYSKMRTVTNFFILNLAIGDILMACTCIPFTFVATFLLQTWIFGETMCIVVSYSQAVSVFVSAYTLVAISIDRYIAIIYPLRPRMTKFQAKLIIALIWLVSLATPLPIAIFSKLIFPYEDDRNKIFCNEDWGKNEYRYYYSMLLMILQYVFPLSVLIFTYTRIALVVWGKQTPGEAEDGRDQRLAASKRKMVKMMITCVTVFTLCWLPLNVLVMISDQYPDINHFSYILYIWFACHFLAMSHACYNPIIYIWMNSRFRDGFKHILSQLVPCLYRADNLSTPDFLPHNLTTNTGHFNFAHSTTKLVSHVNNSNQINTRGSSSQSVSPCIRHTHNNNNTNNNNNNDATSNCHRNSDCVMQEIIDIPDEAHEDDIVHPRFAPFKSTFAKVSVKCVKKSSENVNNTACSAIDDESSCKTSDPSAQQLNNYTSPLVLSSSSSPAKQPEISETHFSTDVSSPAAAAVSSSSKKVKLLVNTRQASGEILRNNVSLHDKIDEQSSDTDPHEDTACSNQLDPLPDEIKVNVSSGHIDNCSTTPSSPSSPT